MVPPYKRLLAAALLFAATAQAYSTLGEVPEDQECGLAMIQVYGEYNWPGTGYGSTYKMLCTNPNALVSAYASLYTYCKESDIAGSLKIMGQKCKKKGKVALVPPTKFAANLTKEAIAALPVYAQDDIKEGSNFTSPWLMSQDYFDIARETEHIFYYEERLGPYYAFASFGFWAVVLVFGMVQNVVCRFAEHRRGYVYADAEGAAIQPSPRAKSSLIGRAVAVTQKYVATPSLLPPYHQRRFLGCTIPTRAEALVVLSYWIFCLVLGFVNYHGLKGNLFWDATAPQIWRYIADRMGVMSYGNLPMLWIFSGRNNILLWLTGWSFGTFNIFHRHVARIATTQAIMHAIAYTCYYFTSGNAKKYHTNFNTLWWPIGIAALVIMSFIIILSFGVFRRRLYEHFLLVHIIFSILLLAFLYHHTSKFDLYDYNYPFLITCCGIWGFERLVRLVRQVYINARVHVRSGKGIQATKTTVTYHEAANILAIDVVPGNANLFPGPGQHYFLYQPFRFFGWENHPFTLARWVKPQAPGEDLRLEFRVRPYDGWTKHLVKECKAKGGATATITPAMLLEGPYGKAEPLHTFENVLLVAGGSGIAGVMPYIYDHVRRTEKGAAAGPNGKIPTRTRNITLIFADRSEEYLHFIAQSALAGLLSRPDINVSFHLTGSAPPRSAAIPAAASSTASSSTDAVDSPTSPSEKSVQQFASEKGGVLEGASAVRIQAGRPDVLSTVRKMAASVHGTNARLAVMVCGPSGLADNVRHVVAQNMETTQDSIAYFEESFGW